MGQNVTIVCSNCKKQSVAPIELVGKQARCPSCKTVFVVRMAGQPVAQPPRPATQQVPRPPTQAVPRPAQPTAAPAARQPTGTTSARLPAQRPAAPARGQAPRPQTQSLPAQRPTGPSRAVPAQQPPAPAPTRGAPAVKNRLSRIGERPGARHRLPPKRKSNKALYFVLTILVLAGLGAGLAWVMGVFENPKEDVKKRFEEFVSTMNREDLEEAKKFFYSSNNVPPHLDQMLKLEYELSIKEIQLEEREVIVRYTANVKIRGDKEQREVKLASEDPLSIRWKQGGDKNWYISSGKMDYPFNDYFIKYTRMMEEQPH